MSGKTLADISSGPDWVLYLVTALFAALSLLLLLGKGSWLIAGYNTAPREEKQRYDEKRLCRVTGVGMAVLSALLALMTIWEEQLPRSLPGFSPRRRCWWRRLSSSLPTRFAKRDNRRDWDARAAVCSD